MKRCGKRTYITILCLVIISSNLFLTGGSFARGSFFSKPELALAINNNVIYQCVSASDLLAGYDNGVAKEEYNDSYLVVRGSVAEIKNKNKTFLLDHKKEKNKATIVCKTNKKNIIQQIGDLKVDDDTLINVYGKVSVNTIGKEIEIEIDQITTSSLNTMPGTYVSKNQVVYNSSNLSSQSIGSDRVMYYVPIKWNTVAHNIIEEGLGEIDGYQYRLNEIKGNSYSKIPESFFVCYFDNKKLKNPSDKKDIDAVERSIICNILGIDSNDIGKFPVLKEKTYYGVQYKYYQDAYRNVMGDGYHVEFAFQQDSDKGIVVYIYVYKDEKNHLDDVFAVMRLLQINE